MTRLLPPKREPWQLVLGPPGYFAIYSNLIEQYTQTDLTEEQAYATCRHEYGLTPAEAAAKVQAALDKPRLVYDLESNLPIHQTTWFDLQREHYQSTPTLLKRMAIARRNQSVRSLHAQTAQIAREDWYAHVAKLGLTFVQGDRGWQSALRLASLCFGTTLAHDYVRLAICPTNAPGSWCLDTNLRSSHVHQIDVECAFTNDTCGKSMSSDCPALDPGPCLRETAHLGACFDGTTYFDSNLGERFGTVVNGPRGHLTRMSSSIADALHVFQMADGDTVIARSARDAWDILTETSGTTPEDMPGEEWAQLNDTAPLRIGCEDPPEEHGFPSDEGWAKPPGRSIWVSERTCAEWIALCGRGVLGGPD